MKKKLLIKHKIAIILALLFIGFGYSCGETEDVVIPAPVITQMDPELAPANAEVTIIGENFRTSVKDNKVTFNGIEAEIVSSTGNKLKVIVPATASTGDVVVTANNLSSEPYKFTVAIPVNESLKVLISDENDDVEEGGENGAMALSSSDLELGEYDTWEQDGVAQGNQTIGLRFNNITIPQSAKILSVAIQFTVDDTGAEPVQMTIYGENVGNAEPYTTEAYNVSNRPKTTAKAVWDIPEWVNVGDAGDAQKTVDLKDIVQEIVNRSDWAAGNSINFIMVPTVYISSSHGGREAEAGVGDDSATLIITYEK